MIFIDFIHIFDGQGFEFDMFFRSLYSFQYTQSHIYSLSGFTAGIS